MPMKSAYKIEDVLLNRGLLTQEQYDEIKKISLTSDRTAIEIIEENGYVSDVDILKIQSELNGMEYIDPREQEIPVETLNLINEKVASKYTLIPISVDKYAVNVVMADPYDLEVIQLLERTTKKSIHASTCIPEYITEAIEKNYGRTFGAEVTAEIEKVAESTTQKIAESLNSIDQAEDIIKVSPVAKVVGIILEYAVKTGASDIHIEAGEEKTRVRYRIDGVLVEKFPLPKSIHNSVIARIKILANMPIDERRKPLDGKFKVEVGKDRTDLRVSTLPTVFGEKCVIRLLKSEGQVLSLDQLGLWGDEYKTFYEALNKSTGIILVTGPTGSGKTVTMATSLQKLNSPKVNIITLEDPVEISIPGANQVQINPTAGLTFATGLRAILRQDPNIIMVGEIRDLETARLAIQAALTGHLVLATLHTNSASGAIPRLIDMGVEPFLLSSTINVSLAQRLSRRICKNCIEEYEADEVVSANIRDVLGDRLLALGMGTPQLPIKKEEDQNHDAQAEIKTDETKSKKIKLFRGKGCQICGNTGYKGRIGLYEVMKITTEIQRLTESSSPEDIIQKTAKEQGLITLVQDGYIKALWGMTTIEEVLNVADVT